MSSHVFISYTSRDSCVNDAALIKAKSLFSGNSSVFVDRLSKGTGWHPQLVIMFNIIRSHLLVVVESNSVYQSPWVLLEILLAKITLTPIIRLPIKSLETSVIRRNGKIKNTCCGK
jgi:hypothetical protein